MPHNVKRKLPPDEKTRQKKKKSKKPKSTWTHDGDCTRRAVVVHGVEAQTLQELPRDACIHNRPADNKAGTTYDEWVRVLTRTGWEAHCTHERYDPVRMSVVRLFRMYLPFVQLGTLELKYGYQLRLQSDALVDHDSRAFTYLGKTECVFRSRIPGLFLEFEVRADAKVGSKMLVFGGENDKNPNHMLWVRRPLGRAVPSPALLLRRIAEERA